MLNGINMLKAKNTLGPLAFLNDTSKMRQQAQTEAMQGARYMSNYKAELVRHNIVTRTDLMKLYHPPIKKASLPSKDPFLMRQIVPALESMGELPGPQHAWSGLVTTVGGANVSSRDQQNATANGTLSPGFPALGKTVPSHPRSTTSGAATTMNFIESQRSEQELMQKHSNKFTLHKLRRASYNPVAERAKQMNRATGRTQPALEKIYKRKQYLAADG
mmetsp:Transcript_23365/g.28979  ORF Transcript_23365/g.28979 Transcript_23365/m.28979 type:complete len:218 (+) Transcript_23365:2199-2852(+)